MSTSPADTRPPEVVGRQGNYAGAVTRLVAFAADFGISWGLYTIGLAGFSFAVNLVTGKQVDFNNLKWLALAIFVIWEFIYFAYQWSLGGKTVGMALLGVKVVDVEGGAATGRQAVYRTLALPLSFLFFGLGFLGILLNKDRHAWHDRLARTVVVYSWDARAARLRWLAKQEPTGRT